MMRFSTLLTAAILSAGLALAQPQPAAIAQMRVSHLATALNLTDTQKTQATTIFTNAQTAEQSIRTNLRTTHQNLVTAIKNNDSATIDQLSTAIGNSEGQIAAIHAKAEAAFYATLTPAQQAQYTPGGGFSFGGGGGDRRPRQ